MARRPPKFHSEHATECINSVCLQRSLQKVSVSAHPAHRNVFCVQHSTFPSLPLEDFPGDSSLNKSYEKATQENLQEASSSATKEPLQSDLKTYQALNSFKRQ